MLRREISLVTTVWGQWHTDVFLRLNLPSLLATGNLPALAHVHSLSFVIFTTKADRSRIEQARSYQQLAGLMPVRFERIADDEIQDPIATQQRVWSNAIEEVSRLGTYLFFLPPDIIWSSRSMEHIGGAMAKGARIVIVPWGLRVVSETFERAISAYFETQSEPAGISSRELVRMALQNLHPLMAAYKRDSPVFPHHTEMLLEAVRGQGLLMRLLASIPTVYEPKVIPLNHNKLVIPVLPDAEIYIPQDSDEVFVASLTPLQKDTHFFDRPRRADPTSIGQWWQGYPSGTNDILVRTNYRIHYGNVEPSLWKEKEFGFNHFLRRSVIAREALSVWNVVRKRSDCSIAAEALAGALQTGTLGRAVRGSGRRLILLPDNQALQRELAGQLDFLSSRKGRRDLIGILRRHMARLTPSAVEILKGAMGSETLPVDDGGGMVLSRNDRGALFVEGNEIGNQVLQAADHVVLITNFVRGPSLRGSRQGGLLPDGRESARNR